jgi:flavodoxin
MNIGIIIHSKTGHTQHVADQLVNVLTQRGHTVRMQPIEDRPDISKFDALILGSHTEGFALAPEMIQYLKSLNSIENQKVSLLITHFFPLRGMGGTQAMAGMKTLVSSLGGQVIAEEIIDWSGFNREHHIQEAAMRIADRL